MRQLIASLLTLVTLSAAAAVPGPSAVGVPGAVGHGVGDQEPAYAKRVLQYDIVVKRMPSSAHISHGNIIKKSRNLGRYALTARGAGSAWVVVPDGKNSVRVTVTPFQWNYKGTVPLGTMVEMAAGPAHPSMQIVAASIGSPQVVAEPGYEVIVTLKSIS